MSACLVYMTAPDLEQAEAIARALIDERLAACVNLVDGMRSLYRWQGAVTQDREVVMIAKTRRDLADRLTERVLALHPYDCPCIVTLPIDGGNPAFLDWIVAETGPG